MTLSLALNNALSGLTANTRQTETISNNVSNALTEGYGRRDVVLTSAGLVGGVRVEGIDRAAAPAVTQARRFADAAAGETNALSNAYAAIADAMGEPGEPRALATLAADLERTLSAAADTPESTTNLRAASLAAGDYVASINRIAAEVIAQRVSADASIATQVNTINSSLAKIGSINAEIKARQLAGGDVSALVDQREAEIKQISGMIPIRTIDRPNGEVALYTQNGGQLLDGRVFDLGFTASPTAPPDASVANGGLSALTTSGVPIAIGEPGGRGLFDGGSLSAAFEVRDRIMPDALAMMDGLAADLIQRVEGIPEDATLAPGDPGLFTDGGAAFDASNTIGLSLRLSLNASADIDAGGDPARLRDGLNAAGPGLAGDAGLLRGLQDALSRSEPAPAGSGLTGLGGAAGFAAEASAFFLTEANRAEGDAAFQLGAAEALRDAELGEIGVDTDQELARLLQVEQAFAANARVVQVVDDLLEQLTRI